MESNFQLPLDQKKNHQGLMIDLKNFKGLLFDMKVCECIPVCLNVCKKAFSQRNSMDSKVYDKILIKYKAHSMDTTAEPDEYESTKSFGNFTQVFVPANKLYMIEAEAFWFLGRLLDSVQDNYTPSQTGIARQISIMIKVLGRTNPRLMSHLRALHVEPLQYAFRWMNCMLIREFPLHTVIRLWDSYLGESEESFCEFHIYVCVAFLAHWEPVILEMHDFNDVIIFLQAPPTQNWTNGDLEILLSQAYVWKAMFSDR